MRPGTRLVPSASRRIPRQPALSHLALGVALSALSLILPLASASLPDPPWVHGVYDDGDNDLLLVSVGDMSPLNPPPSVLPVSPRVWSPTLPAAVTAGFDPPATVRLRAPPRA
jgi:hypothetical protein